MSKKTEITEFRNRILNLPTKPASDFLANPHNARIHPEAQRKAVKGSLSSLGWIDAVIVNKRTGNLVDGHERVWQALVLGDDTPVPYMEVDLDESEEKQALLTFDYITTMAVYDKDIATELMHAVETDNEDVMALMAAMSEGLDLGFTINTDIEVPADAGAQVDRAGELQAKWQTARGQVWRIGAHRVMCGDSTSAEDMATLMNGAKAQLVVTDPPYGVDYSEKNAFLNTIAFGNRIQTPIEGDYGSKDDIQAMWKSAFKCMSDAMSPGAVVYCFMPQGGDQMMMMMMMMMMGAGIEPRHELIWLKNNHVLGRADYAYKHEPILYAWKAGGHKYYGGFQTSILEFPKPLKSDLHPTTKPVELVVRLVENSSLKQQSVLDPFLGSGTTLIACEQTGRVCYGMEISPEYVAVILQRAADMGLMPELER